MSLFEMMFFSPITLKLSSFSNTKCDIVIIMSLFQRTLTEMSPGLLYVYSNMSFFAEKCVCKTEYCLNNI